jgi:hypothetical protein
MALATGSGSAEFTGIPAASAVPLTCQLTVISRTMLSVRRTGIGDRMPKEEQGSLQ